MKTQRKPLANGSESGAGVLQAEIMKPANLLLQILLGLLLTVPPNLCAQPVPHHFDGIAALPDRTITLSLDGSDSRVKCAMLLDATNVQLNPAGLQKPFLVALGENNAFYSEDHWLFSKATTNAVFLQIRGADHMTPCDAGWTAEIPQGRRPALTFDDCAV
jgi:hypothetical protein